MVPVASPKSERPEQQLWAFIAEGGRIDETIRLFTPSHDGQPTDYTNFSDRQAFSRRERTLMGRIFQRDRLPGESDPAYQARLAYLRQADCDRKKLQREPRPDETPEEHSARLGRMRAANTEAQRRRRSSLGLVDTRNTTRPTGGNDTPVVIPTNDEISTHGGNPESSELHALSFPTSAPSDVGKTSDFRSVIPTVVIPNRWNDKPAVSLPPYGVGGGERETAPVIPTVIPNGVIPTGWNDTTEKINRTVETLSAVVSEMVAKVAALEARIGRLEAPQLDNRPAEAKVVKMERENRSLVAVPQPSVAPALVDSSAELAAFDAGQCGEPDVAVVWKLVSATALLDGDASAVPWLRPLELHALEQIWRQAQESSPDQTEAEALFSYWVESFLSDRKTLVREKVPDRLYVRLHQLPTKVEPEVRLRLVAPSFRSARDAWQERLRLSGVETVQSVAEG